MGPKSPVFLGGWNNSHLLRVVSQNPSEPHVFFWGPFIRIRFIMIGLGAHLCFTIGFVSPSLRARHRNAGLLTGHQIKPFLWSLSWWTKHGCFFGDGGVASFFSAKVVTIPKWVFQQLWWVNWIYSCELLHVHWWLQKPGDNQWLAKDANQTHFDNISDKSSTQIHSPRLSRMKFKVRYHGIQMGIENLIVYTETSPPHQALL